MPTCSPEILSALQKIVSARCGDIVYLSEFCGLNPQETLDHIIGSSLRAAHECGSLDSEGSTRETP